MSRLARVRRRLGDERGLTLLELLAAMSSGLIVAAAAFSLLTTSQHLSSRATDQINADQRGRVAMDKIVQQLHSSCIAAAVTPVQPQSNANNLIFLQAYGSGVTLTPNKQSVSLSGGTLTETSTLANGGNAPTWTFPATPTSTTQILTNVSPAVLSGVTQPLFQYFAYSNGSLSPTPLAVPLTTASAQSVAEIDISFAAGPSTPGGTQADRTVNQYSRAVLRLSPASGTATTNAPCA
jgi:hypothetical protein